MINDLKIRRGVYLDWEKANLEMGKYLESLLAYYVCQKKPMFGSPVYFVNNNMWTGVKGEKFFLRLPEGDRAAIQSEYDEVKPFEPRPDFIMKEYVEIPDSLLTDDGFIHKWLDISYGFVRSLPEKVKKKK